MLTISFHKSARAAAFGALALVGAAAAVLASTAEPAAALCKYGTPNCINKNPGPKLPTVPNTRLPESNWQDPDCQHYGNCHRKGS